MATGEEILAWKKAAGKQVPHKRPDCPICGWPVEETNRAGLHCTFCGWTERLIHSTHTELEK